MREDATRFLQDSALIVPMICRPGLNLWLIFLHISNFSRLEKPDNHSAYPNQYTELDPGQQKQSGYISSIEGLRWKTQAEKNKESHPRPAKGAESSKKAQLLSRAAECFQNRRHGHLSLFSRRRFKQSFFRLDLTLQFLSDFLCLVDNRGLFLLRFWLKVHSSGADRFSASVMDGDGYVICLVAVFLFLLHQRLIRFHRRELVFVAFSADFLLLSRSDGHALGLIRRCGSNLQSGELRVGGHGFLHDLLRKYLNWFIAAIWRA